MTKLGNCVDELTKLVERLKVNNPTNNVPEISVAYLRKKYGDTFDEAWSILMFKRMQADGRLTEAQADWVKASVDDMEDDLAKGKPVMPFYEEKPAVLQKPKAKNIIHKGVKK